MDRGKKLIIIVACCEGAVLLTGCLIGLWIYLNT
jgi:hypothetical protein